MHGFTGNRNLDFQDLEKELAEPTDMRIFVIAQALEKGMHIDKIHDLTKIDRWFLYKLKNIVGIRDELCSFDSLESVPLELLSYAKTYGFSDFQVARHVLKSAPAIINRDMLRVREIRKKAGIIPYVRQIDTLAAEYPAVTNYLYLTYSASEHDISFGDDKKSVIVLGSGAYRIGSSVEFDWCSVNSIDTIKRKDSGR
jgi:carbamoyl-phosphate synthase large subunit